MSTRIKSYRLRAIPGQTETVSVPYHSTFRFILNVNDEARIYFEVDDESTRSEERVFETVGEGGKLTPIFNTRRNFLGSVAIREEALHIYEQAEF